VLIRFFAVAKKERVKNQSEEQMRMTCAAAMAALKSQSRHCGPVPLAARSKSQYTRRTLEREGM
jgi:hypothetical protein